MTRTSAEAIRIGSYQLGERVGEGGSAEVFAASDSSGREFAVKLLGAHAELDDPNGRRRFEREIELLSGVSHPNLVTLLDSGVDGEFGPYLVTELVRGPSLREHVGVGPDLAALLLAPVTSAVASLHRAGLVHRDLKPENILLAEDGRVVLIDLGLALVPGQTRYTEEGEVTGSVPYMAPEQIEGREVDAAADAWALGVLVYELVSGKRPFTRERPSEEAAAILVGSCPRLDAVDERVPRELADLIERCLSRHPQARPGAAAVADALNALCDFGDGRDGDAMRREFIESPAALARSIAEFRTAALRAEAKSGSLSPFDATRQLSRALAYSPSDQALRAEVLAAPTPTGAPEKPRSRALLWAGGGFTALLGIAVIAMLLADDSKTEKPKSLERRVVDALVEDLPDSDKSDVAAERVVGGMVQLFGRSLAAERDADGNLVAAQGGEGEPSNEELTLDVFGGLLDLAEEGMAAKKRNAAPTPAPTKSDAVSIDRPSGLSDSDSARDLALVVAAKGEPLLEMAGKSPAQLKAMLGEVRRLKAENPGDANVRMIEAMYLLASGDSDAGIAALDSVREDAPELATAHLVAARVALRKGDLDAAESAIGLGLKANPRHATGLAMRGVVHYLRGETSSAYDDLARAVSIDDQDPYALYYTAELLISVAGEDAATPLIRQLQSLSLDAKLGAAAVDYLGRLCQRGASSSC